MPADPKPETGRTVEDRPHRPLDLLRGRDVLLVIGVGLGLVAAASCGLGMFLLIDTWVQTCGSWGGIG